MSKSSIEDFIRFTKDWEGGLSKALTDTASKNSYPNGYHTNKGITKTTFESLSSKLKYIPSWELFKAMPDKLWFEIFKQGYWNPYNLDDLVKTKPRIAYFIAGYAWGFGVFGAEVRLARFQRSVMGIVDNDIKPFEITANFKADKRPESLRLRDLVESKAKAFVALNQPKNLKGWLNRLNDFQKKFNPSHLVDLKKYYL